MLFTDWYHQLYADALQNGLSLRLRAIPEAMLERPWIEGAAPVCGAIIDWAENSVHTRTCYCFSLKDSRSYKPVAVAVLVQNSENSRKAA